MARITSGQNNRWSESDSLPPSALKGATKLCQACPGSLSHVKDSCFDGVLVVVVHFIEEIFCCRLKVCQGGRDPPINVCLQSIIQTKLPKINLSTSKLFIHLHVTVKKEVTRAKIWAIWSPWLAPDCPVHNKIGFNIALRQFQFF